MVLPRKFMKYLCTWIGLLALGVSARCATDLERNVQSPPQKTRPWVYWHFMDGNLTREGLTADLEAMRDAGIGGAIFLEASLGQHRGLAEFMSQEWRRLFAQTITILEVDEAVAAHSALAFQPEDFVA